MFQTAASEPADYEIVRERNSDSPICFYARHLEAFVWARLCQLAAKLASAVKASKITRETQFTEDLGYG